MRKARRRLGAEVKRSEFCKGGSQEPSEEAGESCQVRKKSGLDQEVEVEMVKRDQD